MGSCVRLMGQPLDPAYWLVPAHDLGPRVKTRAQGYVDGATGSHDRDNQ